MLDSSPILPYRLKKWTKSRVKQRRTSWTYFKIFNMYFFNFLHSSTIWKIKQPRGRDLDPDAALQQQSASRCQTFAPPTAPLPLKKYMLCSWYERSVWNTFESATFAVFLLEDLLLVQSSKSHSVPHHFESPPAILRPRPLCEVQPLAAHDWPRTGNGPDIGKTTTNLHSYKDTTVQHTGYKSRYQGKNQRNGDPSQGTGILRRISNMFTPPAAAGQHKLSPSHFAVGPPDKRDSWVALWHLFIYKSYLMKQEHIEMHLGESVMHTLRSCMICHSFCISKLHMGNSEAQNLCASACTSTKGRCSRTTLGISSKTWTKTYCSGCGQECFFKSRRINVQALNPKEPQQKSSPAMPQDALLFTSFWSCKFLTRALCSQQDSDAMAVRCICKFHHFLRHRQERRHGINCTFVRIGKIQLTTSIPWDAHWIPVQGMRRRDEANLWIWNLELSWTLNSHIVQPVQPGFKLQP